MSNPPPSSAAHDRRFLHRPTAWWVEFTRPLESVTPKPVSVRLVQGPADIGWIDLTIRLGDEETVIALTEVYDPFLSLLAWLKALREDDLPIGIDIDEENSVCRLVAHPFSEHQVLIAAFDRYRETSRVAAAVNRHVLLGAFRDALASFILLELDVPRWLMNGTEDGDVEVAEYKGRLLAHPFFAD